METQNADVEGSQKGHRVLLVDGDTDVEEDTSNPDAGCPESHRTAPRGPDTNGDPDVKLMCPNPDVGAPKAQRPLLNADRGTDVEDNGGIPDVGTTRGGQGAPGDPDVPPTSPNPDVSSPMSPPSDSDTDTVAPTPDVRSLQSRIRSRNRPHPDVEGPTVANDPDVEEMAPKRPESPPKRPESLPKWPHFSPKSPGDPNVEGTAPKCHDLTPKCHDLAPKPDEEAPNPDVGAQRPDKEPPVKDPAVLFTGVVASPATEVALKTLGGSMATSVFDCTHLVTDRVRRTVKFLCAVARGVPIVTPEWLHKSARSGRVLAPGPFLVRDAHQERHFGFNLAQALRRARCHPLLQ
ncbi:MDC1 protein, partial [Corythaixoides concolor]|nr:MDC1 protein [Corythaixoides concolor]